MKTLIVILSFLFLGTDLPKSNQTILDYANSQLGKKVKSGICFDLVDASYCQVDKNWKKNHQKRIYPLSHTYKYIYGTKINKKDLVAGDIIQYEWKMKTETGKTMQNGHICIVHHIEGDKIYVIEQNAAGSVAKSKVVINCLNDYYEYSTIYNEHYYRPF